MTRPGGGVPGPVLAVDPGLVATGWSVWAEGALVACGLSRGVREGLRSDLGGRALPIAEGVPTGAAVAVVERMVSYPFKDNAATASRKANDLLDLQALGGLIAGRSGAERVVWVTPKEWKGERPTDVILRQMLKHAGMTTDEKDTFHKSLATYPAGLGHNLTDAVGIGLWYLRRLP